MPPYKGVSAYNDSPVKGSAPPRKQGGRQPTTRPVPGRSVTANDYDKRPGAKKVAPQTTAQRDVAAAAHSAKRNERNTARGITPRSSTSTTYTATKGPTAGQQKTVPHAVWNGQYAGGAQSPPDQRQSRGAGGGGPVTPGTNSGLIGGYDRSQMNKILATLGMQPGGSMADVTWRDPGFVGNTSYANNPQVAALLNMLQGGYGGGYGYNIVGSPTGTF